jgi:5-methylcytosine-specific restriction endonuclease McrA
MPMRICATCQGIVRTGETVHVDCRKRSAYNSGLHRLMSVFYRTGNVPCAMCRQTGTPENPITAHHVVPVSEGGQDVPENYRPLCRVCNSQEGSRQGTE